jgi:hypothetical protein
MSSQPYTGKVCEVMKKHDPIILSGRPSWLEKTKRSLQRQRDYMERNKENMCEYAKEHRIKMSPSYTARLLNMSTSTLENYPELLDAKRQQVKITRQLKQQKELNV